MSAASLLLSLIDLFTTIALSAMFAVNILTPTLHAVTFVSRLCMKPCFDMVGIQTYDNSTFQLSVIILQQRERLKGVILSDVLHTFWFMHCVFGIILVYSSILDLTRVISCILHTILLSYSNILNLMKSTMLSFSLFFY